MSTIGNSKIDTNEANARVTSIRTHADRVKDILDAIVVAMDNINNEDTNIYQGTTKAQELREKVDVIKSNFEPLYNQIMSFANQIEEAAANASNQ